MIGQIVTYLSFNCFSTFCKIGKTSVPGDFPRALYGFVRRRDHPLCVAVERLSSLRQTDAAVGAREERDAYPFFQRVDLVHDGDRRDVHTLCGFGETAGVGDLYESIELRIVHACPFVFSFN